MEKSNPCKVKLGLNADIARLQISTGQRARVGIRGARLREVISKEAVSPLPIGAARMARHGQEWANVEGSRLCHRTARRAAEWRQA